MNYNKVIIAGRLTRDPKLGFTGSGVAVCDIGLAINETYEKDGHRVEKVHFVNVTAWKRQAEVIAKHFRKGKQIFIEGSLDYSTWEQNGQKRSGLKVTLRRFEFVGPKEESGSDDLPPGLNPKSREVILESRRAAGLSSQEGDDIPF